MYEKQKKRMPKKIRQSLQFSVSMLKLISLKLKNPNKYCLSLVFVSGHWMSNISRNQL